MWGAVIVHQVLMSLSLRFLFSVFIMLSYQMLDMDCKNAENLTFVYEKKFFYDRRKFRRQCVNRIDATWSLFFFLHAKISDENSVQRPLDLSLPSENIQKLVEFSDGTVTPFYLLLTGSLCLTFLIQLKCLCDVLLIKSWWHAPRPPTPVNRCLCKLHRRLFARPFKAFHSIDSGSRCWFDVALWPSVSLVI